MSPPERYSVSESAALDDADRALVEARGGARYLGPERTWRVVLVGRLQRYLVARAMAPGLCVDGAFGPRMLAVLGSLREGSTVSIGPELTKIAQAEMARYPERAAAAGVTGSGASHRGSR